MGNDNTEEYRVSKPRNAGYIYRLLSAIISVLCVLGFIASIIGLHSLPTDSTKLFMHVFALGMSSIGIWIYSHWAITGAAPRGCYLTKTHNK